MVDTAHRPSTGEVLHQATARPVRRRRSLPSSRAVVGGLLVTAAAVGTFGAYTSATTRATDTYVALTRDVPAGERIEPGDVALVEAELAAPQRRIVLTDLAIATGAVAVGALQAGQLLGTGDVVELAGELGRAQLSIPVEPARANNGQLTPGERVDVIATSTTGGTGETRTIATDAVVVRVFTGEQSLASSATVVVTLSLTADELEPVAAAAAGDTIALARVSGLDRGASGGG